MVKPSSESPGFIRKTVGRERPLRPLERAFRLYRMLVELRGEREDGYDGEHIRKIVGRKRVPKQKTDA